MRATLVGLCVVVIAGCAEQAAPADATLSDAGTDAGRRDADVDARHYRPPDAWVDPVDAWMRDGFVPGVPRETTRPIAPLSGSRVSTRRPTLRWALATGIEGARIELCRDRDCATTITTLDVAAPITEAVPDVDLPPGIVWWRVVGTGGAPSATWRLKVPHASAATDTSWGHEIDLDGDGFADVPLARTWTPSCTSYPCPGFEIAYGSPTGWRATRTTIAEPDRTYGAWGGGHTATDVNGDGISDLVVRTTVIDGSFDPPALELFLGQPGGLIAGRAQTLARPPDSAYEFAPESLANVGDVDGDGYGDIVITASTIPDAAAHPRVVRMFVYPGGPSGLGAPREVPLAASFEDDPAVAYAIGDVTGDGRADLAVGRYDRLLVLAGDDAGGFEMVLNARVMSAHTSAPTVGPPADLDGNGWPDLVVGTETRILLFPSSGTGAGIAPTPSDTWTTPANGYWIGASPGDVDGDGIDDLVTCWTGYLVTKESVGSCALFLGTPSGPDTSAPDAEHFWLPGGSIPGAGPAAYPLEPGDVTGDGYDDVLLGMLLESQARLVRGSPTAPHLVVEP